MIRFVELVPVEVDNPKYEEELSEFMDDSTIASFGQPPSKKITIHENHEVDGLFEWMKFNVDEEIYLNGHSYSVQAIGPKSFISGLGNVNFTQTIYIKKV